MTSVNETVDSLVQAFQEFKSTDHKELEEKVSQLDRIIAATKRPTLGDVNMTSILEDTEYKKAFTQYIRRGEEGPLQSLEHKNLSTLVDSDGGYTIPQTLVNRIELDLSQSSIIRGLANVMQVSSSSVDLLLNKKGAEVGWTGESDDRKETGSPELQKLTIAVHEMYAKPRATQKLLDDSAINVEDWLIQAVALRMAELENQAFLFGDGTKKPKGLLSYPTDATASWGKFAHVPCAKDKEIELVDGLVSMTTSLKTPYLNDATWLMSQVTLDKIRKLKGKDGRFLWQPNLEGGTPSLLMGYKVHLCDELPAFGDDKIKTPLVFGNFKRAYQIVDRQGTNVLRDPYSAKPYVEFYTTKRVGGDVINFEALVILKTN
jgi:HK97 family phage major capsid protein